MWDLLLYKRKFYRKIIILTTECFKHIKYHAVLEQKQN